jgi:multidrug resistance efflux pump
MLAREQALQIDLEFMIHGPRDIRIEAAKQRVNQAEEERVKAKWRLDNCIIRAPISGTILTKFAEEGNIVNQLSLNLKGSICDMADLSDLEVDLSIQERDVARVFKDQRCRIRPEAYPDRIYEGYVSRLMPIADRGKGAVPVRVKLIVPKDEEQGAYLKPEMGAVVSFLKKEEAKETKK